MEKYILQFKTWFLNRSTRERCFVLILGWALIYFIFYFIFFKSIDEKTMQLNNEITQLNHSINNWQLQINALQKISQTALYKEWIKQHQSINQIENKYKKFLQTSSSAQWEEVVQAVLQTTNTIKIENIKNFPKTAFQTGDPRITSQIYEQPFVVTMTGNYFNTIEYLQYLEKTLPNVQWKHINYHVTHYPLAEIELEFSILYEEPITFSQ